MRYFPKQKETERERETECAEQEETRFKNPPNPSDSRQHMQN
jgi:hypothetical protein